ncbi:MAG: prolipoprotein diacylglyceryl transferase [Candidatus Omnitrophica bacterium]|nr:prolipoprotein diacylglyceryl transferase [Candidatus Omnitrophota bacterium]
MHPVLFRIGSLTIYTYGFFVFLGILAGYLFSLRESLRYGISQDKISDLIFWSLLAGLASSRLFYIIINWKYFLEEPLGFIISGSGFVFYGGLLGGVLTALFFIKKRGLPLFKTLDLLSPSLCLGHSIGRIGCFFYGCCYGKPTASFLGMVFPADSPAGSLQVPVIPTQLISSFFLLLIFLILIFTRKRGYFEGKVFVSYIVLYSVFRFIIEFYRADPRGFLGFFSVSQWISLILLLWGLIFWKKLQRKINN